MVDVAAMFNSELREEYGFDIPEIDSLVEHALWTAEDLEVDTDDYHSMITIVQGMANAYRMGWDEGLDNGIN